MPRGIPKHPKTHCKRGHPRVPENLYRNRHCKLCNAIRSEEWDKTHKHSKVKASQKWRRAHPDSVRINNRINGLKLRGWTPAMVEKAKAAQNDRCAICQEIFIKTPHADHKHTVPPQPRELLCGLCNMALGGFKDRPLLCEAAATYLRKHGEV